MPGNKLALGPAEGRIRVAGHVPGISSWGYLLKIKQR